MDQKVVSEFLISKATGKAFIVKKDQVLRIIAHEGPQTASVLFFNAHNYHEQFTSRWSAFLNMVEGIGTLKNIKKFYSKVPWENLMLTVLDDPVEAHTFGVACTPRIRKLLNLGEGPTCQDNLEKCLGEFGLVLGDLDGTGAFNPFFNEAIDKERDYAIKFLPSAAKKGDYIDLLAEMDVLVDFSNCPLALEYNDFQPKDMKVQILE